MHLIIIQLQRQSVFLERLSLWLVEILQSIFLWSAQFYLSFIIYYDFHSQNGIWQVWKTQDWALVLTTIIHPLKSCCQG